MSHRPCDEHAKYTVDRGSKADDGDEDDDDDGKEEEEEEEDDDDDAAEDDDDDDEDQEEEEEAEGGETHGLEGSSGSGSSVKLSTTLTFFLTCLS